MPQLCPPTTQVHLSFLAAMAEFQAEGRGGGADNSMIGRDIRDGGGEWSDPGVFSEYVARVVDQAREDAPRPAWMVPSTTLWWVDGTDYLGRISIRHRLTPILLDWGGHIGYDVRPSARRRGYATAMLAAARPVAARLGIDPALVTCDLDNVGSRKVIEANGGVLEDQRAGKLRFWVPTS
jgi:predicted acetyltransferase